MPISTTASVVDLKNQIAATRSQIIDAMVPADSIHDNKGYQLPALRDKLSQLQDALFSAEQAERSNALYSTPASAPVQAQIRTKKVANDIFKRYLKTGELRAGINTVNGSVLIPQAFSQSWIDSLKFAGPILKACSIDDKWPLKKVFSDDTANGMQLVGEQVSTAPAASDPVLTSNTATIWNVDDLVCRFNWSVQQLEDSGFSLDSFMRLNASLRVARSLEKAIWLGTDYSGNALPNSPTGGLLAFAGSAGSPSVNTAATGTVALGDLLALRNSLNKAYQVGGSFHVSEALFASLDAVLDSTGHKLYPRNEDGSLNVDGSPLYAASALTNNLASASGAKLAVFVAPERAYQVILGQTGIRVVSEMPGYVEALKKAMIINVRFGSASLLPAGVACLKQK